ncbi:hypothetical protein [Caballeronia telluris]|uniref:hypothetical protein n=1 Tax=Caballeronia telluris TaxID=326475 RepID=UPI000F7421F7|nr:hypothetical protein [Caballeronia telluris]
MAVTLTAQTRGDEDNAKAGASRRGSRKCTQRKQRDFDEADGEPGSCRGVGRLVDGKKLNTKKAGADQDRRAFLYETVTNRSVSGIMIAEARARESG